MTIIYHPRYVDHFQWKGHPESPQRLKETLTRMKAEGLWNKVSKPEAGVVEDLLLVHSKEHVDRIAEGNREYLDPDTLLRRGTYEIACLAVGGTIRAATTAFEERVPTLALVRPPGHHAGTKQGGGFCYFNNIAIATRRVHKKRVAIVDLDVHHGNGTQGIFYEDPGVLYISMHQKDIYPGIGEVDQTGRDEGEGFTVNFPFQAGAGDGTYEMAMERGVSPIIQQYDPQIMLVSLGVDAHIMDPLASLKLSSPGYISILSRLIDISPQNRISFVLEGGYNVEANAEVLAGLVALFQDRDIDYRFPDPTDDAISGRETIDRVLNTQKRYWDLR